MTSRLTEVGYSHSDSKYRKYFEYVCVCGNKKTIRQDIVRSGSSKSCGCLKLETNKSQAAKMNAQAYGKRGADYVRLPHGVAAFNALFRSYKYAASQRGLVFDLTKDVFYNLTNGKCYYCGDSPIKIFKPAGIGYFGGYSFNGIDRVNNMRGYTPENSVSCCSICNLMKGCLTKEQFFAHIKKISETGGL